MVLAAAAAIGLGVAVPRFQWIPIVVVAVMAAMVIPVKLVAIGWGAFLPIYAVVGVQPAWFDAVRLAGIAIIVLRVRADAPPRITLGWFVPLTILGSYMAVAAAANPGDDPVSGLFIVASAVVAYLIACRLSLYRSVLAGFAIGACASAAVLITQAFGLPDLAWSFDANGRLPGLGSAAPRTSTELAAACVILFLMARAAYRIWLRCAAIAAFALCAVALICSGGRVGLAGLLIAAAVGIRCKMLRLKHALLLIVAAGAVRYLADLGGIRLLTIERLLGDDSGNSSATIGGYDISNGRIEIFRKALETIKAYPIFGTGLTDFTGRFRLLPHLAPLTFGVAAGIVGLIIGIYLVGRLAALVAAKRSALAAGLAAVLLVSALLDPTGPFLGVGLVTLLFVAAAKAELADMGWTQARRNSGDVGDHPHPSNALFMNALTAECAAAIDTAEDKRFANSVARVRPGDRNSAMESIDDE